MSCGWLSSRQHLVGMDYGQWTITSNTTWRHRSESAMAQVTTASSHYMSQRWLKLMVLRGVHLRAIPQEVFINLIYNMCSESIILLLLLHLPGTIAFKNYLLIKSMTDLAICTWFPQEANAGVAKRTLILLNSSRSRDAYTSQYIKPELVHIMVWFQCVNLGHRPWTSNFFGGH